MGALRHNAFGTIADHLEHRLSAGQEAGAQSLLRDIAADMGEAKHGHHWPDLPNVSSAPGESPAIQSAALVESLRVQPLNWHDWALTAGTDHNFSMEYGTIDGHIAPRPYMVPGAHRIAKAHWSRLARILIGKDAT
jgi:hypothetical protein